MKKGLAKTSLFLMLLSVPSFAAGPTVQPMLTVQYDEYYDQEHSNFDSDFQSLTDIGPVSQVKIIDKGKVELEYAHTHGAQDINYTIAFGDDQKAQDNAALFKREMEQAPKGYQIILRTIQDNLSQGPVRYPAVPGQMDSKYVSIKDIKTGKTLTLEEFLKKADSWLSHLPLNLSQVTSVTGGSADAKSNVKGAPEMATDVGLKRVVVPSASEQTQQSVAPVEGAI